MTNTHQYTAERHTYGWLLKGGNHPNGIPMRGIPMQCMKEALELPGMNKNSVMHPGIAHALRAVVAMGSKEDMAKWADEIDADAVRHSPDAGTAWLRGTKTGQSSLSIFYAIEPHMVHRHAHYFSPDNWNPGPPCNVPHDASDFERCLHLVCLMNWRERLPEVAATYPQWAKLVEHWDELAAMSAPMNWKQLTKRIQELTQ